MKSGFSNVSVVLLSSTSAAFHQITVLVYDAFLAQTKKLLGFFEGYFLLKFVARKSAVVRFSLNREIAFAVANAYANGVYSHKIALLNVANAVRPTLPVDVFMNEKLAFYF